MMPSEIIWFQLQLFRFVVFHIVVADPSFKSPRIESGTLPQTRDREILISFGAPIMVQASRTYHLLKMLARVDSVCC